MLDIVPNRHGYNPNGSKRCNDCGWSGEKEMHIRTDLDDSGKCWIQNDERKLPI